MAEPRRSTDERPREQAGTPFPGPAGFGRGGGPGAWMREKTRARDSRATIRRLWRYLRQQPGTLAVVVACVAVSTALGVVGPWLIGVAIDRFIGGKDLPGLARIAALMAAVYLMTGVTTFFGNYLIVGTSQDTLRGVRADLFARLQTLSLGFFDSRPHGDLMSRFTNDVENVSNVLAQSVTQLVSSVLSTLGVAAVMVALNFRLAAVALVTAPLMALAARIVAKRTREGFRDQQRDIGELNSIIEETLTGQRVVKACGREQDAIRRFGGINSRLRGSAMRAQTWAGVLGPVINLLNNLSFAIVAAAGGWLALAGLATVGMVAAFVSYSRQFARPLNEIANLYNAIQSGLAGAERVFEVMDEEPVVRDSPEAAELGGGVRGHIEFRSVRFGYGTGEPVLHDVSFEARPGDVLALVGPTGAGKTTVVSLLARFYDVGSGAVLIDGRDVRSLTQDSLRRGIGIVLQETFLFSATVRENIRYGRLDATDAEVEHAASLANADGFIRHLPEGYETDLSEEASNLSQGQRQLIAIARAALADPAVLVLDEATSSVDTRTEVHVREAMTRLMAGRTSLVIAHRLSTIRAANVILVMDMGRIVERGTHAELLAFGGLYQRLYHMHFSRRAQATGG